MLAQRTLPLAVSVLLRRPIPYRLYIRRRLSLEKPGLVELGSQSSNIREHGISGALVKQRVDISPVSY
jgi:hypothetical protein